MDKESCGNFQVFYCIFPTSFNLSQVLIRGQFDKVLINNLIKDNELNKYVVLLKWLEIFTSCCFWLLFPLKSVGIFEVLKGVKNNCENAWMITCEQNEWKCEKHYSCTNVTKKIFLHWNTNTHSKNKSVNWQPQH